MKYFEVNNDNNHLQIDDTYMNLYMTRKIKLDNTSGTIQFQNGEIMGAIGNGTNSINGYCSNSSDHCDYYIDNAQNAYIYIFATSPQSSSTSGMQIFNEVGKLVFDSNQKQAKVIAVGTNSGTVIGTNIAIASGGLTQNSDLSIEPRTQVEQNPKLENHPTQKLVTEPYTYSTYEYNPQTGRYEYVTKTEMRSVWKTEDNWVWVTYYRGMLYGRKIYHTYIHNVYINGGVISTKQFKEKTDYDDWKLISSSMWEQTSYFPAFSDANLSAYRVARDKSNGVISAYSYIVLDVNGL